MTKNTIVKGPGDEERDRKCEGKNVEMRQLQVKYTTREACHSSTKAESCDSENTTIVTNQRVLKLWKEDEQLCCHPIHNQDEPRKSEREERTNEKR